MIHTYADPDCVKPKYSAVGEGKIHLKRESMRTPGGTEAEYDLERFDIST